MALENLLSDDQALKYNNDSPANQLIQVGSLLKEVQTEIAPDDLKPLLSFDYDITADASAGIDIITEITESVRLVDVVVEAKATSAGGWVVVRNGTDSITNEITMSTDTNIARVGTIDDTYSTFVAGDTVNLITNNVADRGIVTLIFKKV